MTSHANPTGQAVDLDPLTPLASVLASLPPLMTIREVADFRGVSERTVRRDIVEREDGDYLRTIRMRRRENAERVYVRREALLDYLGEELVRHLAWERGQR